MTQKSSTLPLSDAEFILTTFDITTTHSPPPPSHPKNPAPSDIDPILLRTFYKPQSRNSILIPTCNKGRRRHSHFDPFST